MRSVRLGYVLGLALTLSGCATAEATKPALCDGKHRRAVNIHGSVLGQVPAVAATAGRPDRTHKPPTAASTAQPGPAKVSQANSGPQWFPSC
jgi:hypothetical protein